ncbi:DUF1542 domain-containing protein [Streptococcus pseudopneumoniae]|uniref:DUF1542 domain-containing protein n=1 Tax=Streptococcus pseudopneumoniae TaxID=257758 RepID=UPI0018B0AC6F|nr:DUF1542 domain-containing protein [Streptococcus pseudopneumoniae]MBF9680617.1 DUF1542 domain-containing protein [Streptococcus pseudopneumoniae]
MRMAQTHKAEPLWQLTLTEGGETPPGDGATSTNAENQKPVAVIDYSRQTEKEIFVYNEEDANIEIPVYDDSGEILYATFKKGSNQKFNKVTGEANKLNLEYGYTGTVINDAMSDTTTPTATAGTPASQAAPAKISISGKPDVTLKAKREYTKRENQALKIGTRYVKVGDKQGANNVVNSGKIIDPGYISLILKSQTYKYSIQEPASNADKISVTDINNLTEQDIEKIKNQLKVEYSKTSQDARLASQRGTVVTPRESVVKNITVADGNVTVTYKDDSTDVVPVGHVARTNQPPTVEIPYSVDGKKDVYVYANEDIDLDIKYNDDSGKIKFATINKGGNQPFRPVDNTNQDIINSEYGTQFTRINSETSTPATVKIIGKMTKETQGLEPRRFPTDEAGEYRIGTRYATATDTDNAKIVNNATSSSYNRDPGSFAIVLKSQTRKYDIKTPEEADKVVVTDPAAVTEEEFKKVKEKVKLEYSRTNPDKNLLDKRGQSVDNQETKIQSITKNANNELVVTYTDGSIDRRPLTEFTTLNKQPAIDAVNKAAEDKIAEINAITDPNATEDEKQAAIAKVNADKEKALAAINDPNLTTKAALDQAQTEGTTAIAADNPVIAKKAEAKAAIEAARKAKEDAINADRNLSEAEKTAAIAKANAAAQAATEKIDAATTDAAVDAAQTEATTAISKVNPIAKENAKAAIANALTAKNDELDKRTDLSQAEKDAAKAEAKKLADAELAKINAQPDNEDTEDAARATQKLVDAAEDKGVADVTSVTPVAKAAAKKAVADELAAKNKEIDDRQDLTAEEKAKAKAEAQAAADEANQAIDAQPEVAATPEEAQAAQDKVDAAKEKGVEAIKAVNPETTAKAAADKAIDDALAAKNKAIDERTDLTDAEKKAAKDKAKEEADKAKAAVAAATSDAEVAKAKEAGESAVGAVTPVAKDAAKKAVADELLLRRRKSMPAKI